VLQDMRLSTGDTPEKTFENAATVLKQQIKFVPANVSRAQFGGT
jgi:hypothetical protein